MARPRVFDYDAGSDETIVTEGVQGAAPRWIGFDIDKQIIHIVCDEGTLNVTGDAIETVTRSGQQVSLEGADVVTFYTANKAAMDTIIAAAMETWAVEKAKTGTVVET